MLVDFIAKATEKARGKNDQTMENYGKWMQVLVSS